MENIKKEIELIKKRKSHIPKLCLFASGGRSSDFGIMENGVGIFLEKNMIIKGEKIYLQRDLVEENFPLFLKWFRDLEVMKYIGWVKKGMALKNVEELKDFIAELEDGIIFGIYTADDKFIGYASLADFRGQEECEFGIFILDKNFWGKGIGLEVSKLVLNYAFEELEIEKIVLSTSELHRNAIRMYEQLGFKKTKIIPEDRTIFHNGSWILSGTVEMETKKQDFKK